MRSQTETAKRYRYTGKEKDEESGLYYHGARYYAVWLSRWASADPAGLSDGTNSFAALKQNPVLLTDLDGKESSPPDASGGRILWLLTPAHVTPSLRSLPPPAYSAIPNYKNDPVLEPSSDLDKYRATVKDLKSQGLPVGFLETVGSKAESGEYSMESSSVLSIFGDDKFLPMFKKLNLDPASLEGWRKIAEGGHVRVAFTGSLIHEATHAFLDIKNDDKAYADFISKGVEYYRDAPLEGGDTATDPERIFQEAVASYVSCRIHAYARARDQLLAYGELAASGEYAITKEELAGALDVVAREYDESQADLKFGYQNKLFRGQVNTLREISPELRAFIDQNILEGKIPDRFADASDLTALQSSVRERLR